LITKGTLKMRHMNKRKLQPDLAVLEGRLLLSTAANAVHPPQNMAAPVGRAQTCGMTSNHPTCGMTSNHPTCGMTSNHPTCGMTSNHPTAAPMTTTPVARMEPPAMARANDMTCVVDVSM
jgi:hypothetical protein